MHNDVENSRAPLGTISISNANHWILISNISYQLINIEETSERNVVPAKALMPTMLVQEHKDKTITHTVHEVLTWFGQLCLRPRMRENNSTIQ